MQARIILSLSLRNCLLTFLLYTAFYEKAEEKGTFFLKIFAYITLSVFTGFATYIIQVVFKYLLAYFGIPLIGLLFFENNSILFFILKYFPAIGLIGIPVSIIINLRKQAQ
jgi:hypothetical protein